MTNKQPTMEGDLSGPFNRRPTTCGYCGKDMAGLTHATAIIAHALEECRQTLKAQRDAARSLARRRIIAWLRTYPNNWPGKIGEPLSECPYETARFPTDIADALEQDVDLEIALPMDER